MALPDGATVQEIGTINNLLAVHVVDGQDRDSVLLINPSDGHIVRRLGFPRGPMIELSAADLELIRAADRQGLPERMLRAAGRAARG